MSAQESERLGLPPSMVEGVEALTIVLSWDDAALAPLLARRGPPPPPPPSPRARWAGRPPFHNSPPGALPFFPPAPLAEGDPRARPKGRGG